jgi:Flp pilus assembly protein TadB
MLMIATLTSGALAVLLALAVGSSILVSIPGFVIGAFFVFKYVTFDKSKKREEEHRRSRHRHKG